MIRSCAMAIDVLWLLINNMNELWSSILLTRKQTGKQANQHSITRKGNNDSIFHRVGYGTFSTSIVRERTRQFLASRKECIQCLIIEAIIKSLIYLSYWNLKKIRPPIFLAGWT